jgi:hypothetical protein
MPTVTTGTACEAGNIVDPFEVCESSTTGVPKTPTLTSDKFGLANLGGETGRYDYLFVVTPPNVTVKDMQDTSPYSSPSLPYQPYRYKSDQDCLSTDPDNPTSSEDCKLANRISYGLKLHDVSSDENPAPDDPNRAGVFPVCALQKDL